MFLLLNICYESRNNAIAISGRKRKGYFWLKKTHKLIFKYNKSAFQIHLENTNLKSGNGHAKAEDTFKLVFLLKITFKWDLLFSKRDFEAIICTTRKWAITGLKIRYQIRESG